MIGEDGERSPQAEAVMWSFGVVPHDPVEQVIVEGGEVIEQQVLAVVDELFLDGSVEAFAMRVHSRGARVGVPMGEALGVQSGAEVFSELVAVVGEGTVHGHGQQQLAELEGGACLEAGEVADADGEAETAGEVEAGDQIAAHAIAAPLDAVEGDAVAGGFGAVALGFTVAARSHRSFAKAR